MTAQHTRIGFFIGILCSMLLLLTVTIHAQEFSTSPSTAQDDIPRLVRGLNVWRLEAGLEPVVYNPTLEAMAAAQADFLASQDTIDPDNMHHGAQGEDARERSQFPQFAWATYGHPDKFQVTEIAAVGDVDYALSYWRTSDLHSRSVLNHNYREVGVAARKLGSQTLYIVVLGGQPNVLPALVSINGDKLYLTNERNTWKGDWMGEAVSYRLLDDEQTAITTWQPWQLITAVPKLDSDFFYVEYEDADENRVMTKVTFKPRWYATQTIDDNAIVSDDAISEADTTTVLRETVSDSRTSDVVITTPDKSDVVVTPEPTSISPTTTPESVTMIQLMYSETHFTLYNASDTPIDVLNITFTDDDDSFAALLWERVVSDLNIASLPAGHCLQIAGINGTREADPLSECRWIRSLYWLSEDKFFWHSDSFSVQHEGSTLTTCEGDAKRCAVPLD